MKSRLLELLEVASRTPITDYTAEIAAALEEETDPYVRQALGFAKITEDAIREQLAAAYAELDKQVDATISYITSLVTDFASAHDARNNFNKVWFQQQIVSPDAKRRIAESLLNTCRPWLKDAQPSLWKALARGDNEAMISVVFSLEDVSA